MSTTQTPAIKAFKALVADALKTAKETEGTLVHADRETMRLYGTQYVRTLLSNQIDQALPCFEACGLTDRYGRPFTNKLPAVGPFAFVETSQVLRFWMRMCNRAKNHSCPGTEAEKTTLIALGNMISDLDQMGWNPFRMSQVIAGVSGLSLEDAQRVLAFKSVASRTANEPRILAECAQSECRTPKEMLAFYDNWRVSGPRSTVSLRDDAPPARRELAYA